MSGVEGNYIPEPNSGCWLWTKGVNSKGYGIAHVRGKAMRAHRLSWEEANRQKAPANLMVCHKCDVRSCVNPDHLFIGTGSDNMRDCVRKGRHGAHCWKNRHPRHVLTPEQVMSIRAVAAPGKGRASYSALSRQYGVARTVIQRLMQGKTYTHLNTSKEHVGAA